ncbi:MAG: GNAT family N-acetyltransferase [Actinomycetota bacterium]|nr:GNAT family N-acetyltransferase [Actinomycetota bacterium]
MWRAEPEEAADVADLLIEFRDWWGRAAPSAESFLASVERLMAAPDAEFLLGASGDGAPAGVCQLRFRFSVWHAAEDCWLEDLFVCEGARRSGLGAALVEAALDRARERGCARVELDVNEENRAALALYEAFGFSAAPAPGGGRTLLMRRRL